MSLLDEFSEHGVHVALIDSAPLTESYLTVRPELCQRGKDREVVGSPIGLGHGFDDEPVRSKGRLADQPARFAT